MKRSIEAEKLAVEFDQLAVENDRRVNPRNLLTQHGYPFWDTHEASRLLKEDIKQGQTDGRSPKEIYDSPSRRDAYHKFPLEVFRQHIYQERRKQTESVVWVYRRNKKGYKDHEKQAEEEKKTTLLAMTTNCRSCGKINVYIGSLANDIRCEQRLRD